MNIKQIEKDIYYLNLTELKKICEGNNIHYCYYLELNDNKLKKTNVIIRKKHIIKNIIKFLKNKSIVKNIIKKEQNSQQFNKQNINLQSNVFFDSYKFEIGKNLLKKIIKNKYEACVSHVMLYKIWQKRKVYTYHEFAKYYDDNYDKIKNLDHDEWQYIDFIRKCNNINKWSEVRDKISKKVIKNIKTLTKTN